MMRFSTMGVSSSFSAPLERLMKLMDVTVRRLVWWQLGQWRSSIFVEDFAPYWSLARLRRGVTSPRSRLFFNSVGCSAGARGDRASRVSTQRLQGSQKGFADRNPQAAAVEEKMIRNASRIQTAINQPPVGVQSAILHAPVRTMPLMKFIISPGVYRNNCRSEQYS